MTDRSPQRISAQSAAQSAAQSTADHVRVGMFANDRAAQALGIEIIDVQPGQAVLTMKVREDMLNGHDLCQGGLITTLADTCFAYACNSYNELTVAAGFSVDLLAPAHVDDLLTARGVEISKGGRTGLYDVAVTNQRDERIAVFRGRSYTIKGKPAVRVGTT